MWKYFFTFKKILALFPLPPGTFVDSLLPGHLLFHLICSISKTFSCILHCICWDLKLQNFGLVFFKNWKIPQIKTRSSVQSLSRVWLFATSWTAACQASLSSTNSESLLKLMSIKSVMPSNHLILCHPLLLLPPIPHRIRVFSNESTQHMRWPKHWSFSFKHQSFQWTPRTDLL